MIVGEGLMGLILEPAHMEILEKAFFDNLQRDNCEYGAIGVDCKRPFGNSDVEADILEMLKFPFEGDDGDSKCWSRGQREYAAALYSHLPTWLRRKYGSKAKS
jgi:hypothetical protein